jgi:hypothetical protein
VGVPKKSPGIFAQLRLALEAWHLAPSGADRRRPATGVQAGIW